MRHPLRGWCFIKFTNQVLQGHMGVDLLLPFALCKWKSGRNESSKEECGPCFTHKSLFTQCIDLYPQPCHKVGAVICFLVLRQWRGTRPRLHMAEWWFRIWLAGLQNLSTLDDITGLQGREENACVFVWVYTCSVYIQGTHTHTHGYQAQETHCERGGLWHSSYLSWLSGSQHKEGPAPKSVSLSYENWDITLFGGATVWARNM